VIFVSLCLFLLGGVLYLILISLIVQRWLFEPMRPAQITPSYWINMGAAAIATLAGTRLASIAAADPADGSARPANRGRDRAVLGYRNLVGSAAGSAFDMAPRVLIQLVKSLGGRPDYGIDPSRRYCRQHRARVSTSTLWARSDTPSGRAGNQPSTSSR
jgi:Voltage-dependent anion channel